MFWLSAALAAPPLDLPPSAFVSERTEICLPSGLRVLFMQEPDQPTITWTTVVGRGSAADPQGKEGLAHLVEHLWFESQGVQGRSVYDHELALGARMNGFTRPEDTVYPTVAPRAAAGMLVELESARLVDPLNGVDEARFATELGVVRAERRWRYENSGALGYLALLEHAFPEGHRYHRPAIGTEASLASLELEDAQAFANTNYRPAHTTWMVTAPFSFDAFRTVLGRHIAEPLVTGNVSCRASKLPAVRVSPKQRAEDTPVVVEGNVVSPFAYVAWSLPDAFGPDGARFRRMVRSLDWVAPWSCDFNPIGAAALATCVVPLRSEGQDGYATQVRNVLNGVARLWSPGSYTQARGGYVGRRDELEWLFGQVEAGTTAHGDARPWHHTGNTNWFPQQFAVALQQGNEAALFEQWFNPKRAVTVVVEPQRGDTEAIAPRAPRHGPNPPERALNDHTMTDLDTFAQSVRTLDPKSVHQTTLENGLQVWVLPFGKAPFVRSRLVLRGGPGTAPSIMVHLLRGIFVDSMAGVVESSRMTDAPIRIGGSWITSGSSTTTEYGIRSVAARLPSQLYLLRKRIDKMALQMGGRSDIQDMVKEVMWGDFESPATWAALQHELHLMGEAQSVWVPDDLKALRKTSSRDVRGWHRQLLQPSQAILMVVGDVEPEAATEAARASFESWRGSSSGGRPAARDHAASKAKRRVLVLDDPTRADVEVRLSCSAGPTAQSTEEARRVAMGLLKGTLQGELRRELGATYGVFVNRTRLARGTTTYTVTTDVPAPLAGPAVSQMFRLLSYLASGVRQDEVDAQKMLMARTSVRGLLTARDAERRLLAAARSEAGLPWLADRATQLGTVSTKEVTSVVEPCVGHELVTLVGPADAILASADKALQAERFNWDAKLMKALAEHDPARHRTRAKDR